MIKLSNGYSVSEYNNCGTYTYFLQVIENGHDDEYSSDEERGKKVAQKKYEQFQQMCGDLLDPSNYCFDYYWHLLLISYLIIHCVHSFT